METSSSATDFQIAVNRVILKVFSEYGINMDISASIRDAFRLKLYRMGQALSKLGGYGRKKLTAKWKQTTWLLEDKSHQHLLCRKRQLEKDLISETAKRMKLESESKSLKKDMKILADITKQRMNTIVSLQTGKHITCRQTSKSWSTYSAAHRCVKRKSIAENIKAAMSVVDEHFVPLSVDIQNVESGKKETVQLSSGKFVHKATKPSFSDDDMARFALYVKDQFSLSDSAWREISQLSPMLPSLCNLKELTGELNSQFTIEPSPNGNTGVQQSFKSSLLYRVQQLKLEPDETIKVKLTGDGTYYIAKLIVF